MYSKTVTEYLDRTVEKYPDKIAIQDSKRSLSFREVQKEAMHVASFLSSKNLFKKPIAIFLEKSTECFTSIFGVAYSGNFYTIIDVKMPLERIEKILNTLSPEWIITDEMHQSMLSSFEGQCQSITVEKLKTYEVKQEEIREIGKRIIDTDLLYIVGLSNICYTPSNKFL